MTPVAPFALAVALASAMVMGLAIQRGATCMVAAVDEALVQRRFGRAGALFEAALWVGGLVALVEVAGLGGSPPGIFPVTVATVAGGMLLGIGAWINRACVFGSVARIGSGQWAWLATPVGFFLGCFAPIHRATSSAIDAPFSHPLPIALGFAALVLWRLVETARAPNALKHLWHPHRATLLIGVTFVTTMVTVGAWAYTEALAALAKPTQMDARIVLRGTMVIALLAGAVLGGRISAGSQPLRARLPDVARCLAGGAIMGVGAQLVPGSNDGLIMLGLPLLLPHAWIAVMAMALTIALLIALSRSLGRHALG